MTIKHQNKNISAEKQYVITDVQDNPNGILTFTLSNLYSNTTDTLQIDLSKHKLTLTKVTQSELNRLKNSQDEIDIKNRESHIYLVQKNTNDEGVYQEFIWVDNDFEIVGSTAINLEPYFLKENIYNGLDYSQNNNTKALSAYQGYLLNQNKINKSDIVTNLTTDNDNKVLSAKQGKLLQDNKLNKNQTSYKGKNVVVDNNSGEITFEDKPTIPEASTTTPLSDSTNGSTGNSDKWAKADHVHPKSNLYAESGHNHDNTYIKLSDIVTNLTTDNDNKVLSAKQGKLLQDNKLNKNQASYKGKNVVVDNNSGEITFEDKPTIPKAGTAKPLRDSTLGTVGISNQWAKEDHVHPKSNLYAESSHNHDNTYIKLSNTTGLVKNDGTIDTSTYLTKNNFKTIDENSIVGSGNISLPSKLSDLTNDTGFITSAALNDYVTKDNLSIKYSDEKPTEVDPSEPYSLCIVKSSNGYDVYSIQSTGWVKSATIPSDFAISSHNHNDLYYTKSEVDNMNLGSGSSGEVDLSNYIRKSSTSGLVKNDGTIDTTTYSTASHTHGNLQTNGVIGTSNNANKNVITDANGKITTENKPTIPTKTSDLTNDGDGSNVFVKDNDSRLTNSRTPTSHSHGNITNNGRVTVGYDTIIPGPALIADNNDDGTLKTGLLSNAYISDRSSLQNINHSLDGNETSQENVNILIDAKIGDISGALNNKINKSSTKGLVKNDGSIDTTSYLSSLPSHTHTKSEITDFTHTHNISDVATLQTTLNEKANKSHTHNEYVTDQELYDNIPINYVITATDSTSTESVSPFIVGEDYYFTIMAVQTSFIGVTVMSIPINDIRCEIVHSGAVADLTPVKSDENTVTFKFTPTEQKGHILKVYFLGIPVATYTFDAIIDTGWQEVTFKSGYTRYNDSTSVYIRRKGDLVELTGVWKPTSTKTASSTPVPFASIPNELKPKKSINVICPGQGKNSYMLTVDGDALLKWSRYGTTSSIDLSDGHFGSVHCTWIL